VLKIERRRENPTSHSAAGTRVRCGSFRGGRRSFPFPDHEIGYHRFAGCKLPHDQTPGKPLQTVLHLKLSMPVIVSVIG